MTYIPTKEQLKELKFIKKRELWIYELKIATHTVLCYDPNIEQAQKFYAVVDNEEELLEFDTKKDVLNFIKTFQWILNKS